jgi:hypothetical protein
MTTTMPAVVLGHGRAAALILLLSVLAGQADAQTKVVIREYAWFVDCAAAAGRSAATA